MILYQKNTCFIASIVLSKIEDTIRLPIDCYCSLFDVKSNIPLAQERTTIKRIACNHNDDELFPGRALEEPGPLVTTEGEREWFVEQVLDRRRRGRGYQYLVRWRGYGPEQDTWLPGRDVANLEALEVWARDNNVSDLPPETETSD